MLITGAGRGIGRATAMAFAARGARVLCADLDLPVAERTATDAAAAGASAAAALEVDVADRAAMSALAARVADEHGAVDVLVNNAGVGLSGRFLETPLEDWDWVSAINLGGVVNGCHAFGPAMVARGRGHVVNVSSGLAYSPTADEWGYGTTKAAVLAFSRCLRADWRAAGVGVTAICPGVIDTGIIGRTRFRGQRADPRTVERYERLFRRGHAPSLVADAIVAAVERNQAVVPVGLEARVGWWVHRLAPTRVQQWLAGRMAS